FANMFEQMKTRVDWAGPVLDEIENDRRKRLSADQLEERQKWRDRRLMALAAHKRTQDRETGQ
ncbi:MAG: 3-hydroxyacyl-CoA dehydrogenase, partial [Roseibium sp.]